MLPTGVSIDWLSATIPIGPLHSVPQADWERKVLGEVDAWTHGVLPRELVAVGSEMASGRPPYHFRFRKPHLGATWFVHPTLGHTLLELSGSGCTWLRDSGKMAETLNVLQPRVTRLDVAVDILTDTDPELFIADRAATRHKTTAVFESRTGTTCYVGSMRSDSYVRVYRYSPPLPRSDLLRVEFVSRRELAQALVGSILTAGVTAVAAYQGEAFGLQHPDWGFDDDSAELQISRGVSHRRANSVLWLLTQVFPAMRRMAQEGTICRLDCFVDHWLFEIGDCAVDCDDDAARAALGGHLLMKR